MAVLLVDRQECLSYFLPRRFHLIPHLGVLREVGAEVFDDFALGLQLGGDGDGGVLEELGADLGHRGFVRAVVAHPFHVFGGDGGIEDEVDEGVGEGGLLRGLGDDHFIAAEGDAFAGDEDLDLGVFHLHLEEVAAVAVD